MHMKFITIFSACLALYACSSEKAAQPAAQGIAADQSEQAKIYVQIRKLTAQGDIAGAAKLTDNPAAYETKMELVRQAMDEASFAAKMQEAADRPKIEALRDSGAFSMLVVKFDQQGTLERAVTFFRKTGANYKEIIEPDENIPCKLVRDFYAIKGEKNGEVKNCAEDKPEPAA
jgi:hypothetical protein